METNLWRQKADPWLPDKVRKVRRKMRITKRHEETFGDNEHVHYLDYDDKFHRCQNTSKGIF